MDKDISDKTDHNTSKDGYFEMDLKKIVNYSYASILILIVSVVLIALGFRLAAGLIIIADASFSIYLLRLWISAIKKAGETLSDATNSNFHKDTVITGFSHKIREPLNNLVIISDMLMDSGLDNKQKDLLETFVASTNNMVTTVNELTMQSAGSISFEARKKIKFRILPTIQNTIELYSLKDDSKLNFKLNNQEFTDFDCIGDPIILKQIFLAIFNILEDNQAEKPTEITIDLRRERQSEAETVVEIKIQTNRSIVLISETGPENDMIARLIRAGKGTWTQEKVENQTILSINMPFSNALEEPKQHIASPKIEELIQKTKISKELKDLKILIVEDNDINKKITELTLKPLVHSIDTASNGKEALDKFGTSNYDLILMDIQMPVMSGLLAAEKIRALEASTNTHVPIIAITANAMIGDKEKCLSAGIDDYISKPFQPSTLIEKIKSCI